MYEDYDYAEAETTLLNQSQPQLYQGEQSFQIQKSYPNQQMYTNQQPYTTQNNGGANGSWINGKWVPNNVGENPGSYNTWNQSAVPVDAGYAVQTYRAFISKKSNAATMWLIIGILQIVVGVFTLYIVYGLFPIGIGIWNIVASNSERKAVKHFRTTSSGITSYVESQGSYVVELLVNIFLGTWIGIIASIYDMSASNYGKKNRAAMYEVERNGWI